MGKGEITRERIVEAATALASRVGLEGLSIGGLATDLGLSKSGLFAHFGSKEELQLRVLEGEVARFEREVIHPAIKEPRGVPRLRAMFERWLRWNDLGAPGGCLIVTATVEFDDKPGQLREMIADAQQRLLGGIARGARIAKEVGHFQPYVDPDQFAFEMYGIVLSHHFIRRLQKAPGLEERARAAFEALLASYQSSS